MKPLIVNGKRRAEAGFTLMELLVVLVIVITIIISLPDVDVIWFLQRWCVVLVVNFL